VFLINIAIFVVINSGEHRVLNLWGSYRMSLKKRAEKSADTLLRPLLFTQRQALNRPIMLMAVSHQCLQGDPRIHLKWVGSYRFDRLEP
jgi:hypothetical protein